MSRVYQGSILVDFNTPHNDLDRGSILGNGNPEFS